MENGGQVADMLKAAGANKASLEIAIEKIRGGETVNDQNAEDQRQALKNILWI